MQFRKIFLFLCIIDLGSCKINTGNSSIPQAASNASCQAAVNATIYANKTLSEKHLSSLLFSSMPKLGGKADFKERLYLQNLFERFAAGDVNAKGGMVVELTPTKLSDLAFEPQIKNIPEFIKENQDILTSFQFDPKTETLLLPKVHATKAASAKFQAYVGTMSRSVFLESEAAGNVTFKIPIPKIKNPNFVFFKQDGTKTLRMGSQIVGSNKGPEDILSDMAGIKSQQTFFSDAGRKIYFPDLPETTKFLPDILGMKPQNPQQLDAPMLVFRKLPNKTMIPLASLLELGNTKVESTLTKRLTHFPKTDQDIMKQISTEVFGAKDQPNLEFFQKTLGAIGELKANLFRLGLVNNSLHGQNIILDLEDMRIWAKSPDRLKQPLPLYIRDLDTETFINYKNGSQQSYFAEADASNKVLRFNRRINFQPQNLQKWEYQGFKDSLIKAYKRLPAELKKQPADFEKTFPKDHLAFTNAYFKKENKAFCRMLETLIFFNSRATGLLSGSLNNIDIDNQCNT